jgi:hypothetical protein
VNSGETGASETPWTFAIPKMPQNRFSYLDIEEANEDILDTPSTQGTHCLTETPHRPYHKLPKELTVAATPSAHSFNLKVEIQTTDTEEVKAMPYWIAEPLALGFEGLVNGTGKDRGPDQTIPNQDWTHSLGYTPSGQHRSLVLLA